MSNAQIQKPDLWWWKNSKSLQKSKTALQKNFFSDLVIKQVNLLVFMTILWLFSVNCWFQKKISSKLTLRRSDTPWCIFDILSSFWVHWDTLAHWHIISRSYRLQWWSDWAWWAEQSLFVSAASFFWDTL